MKVAVCDDEKSFRDLLGDKVRKIYPEAELQFFETGDQLLTWEQQPDILFLDIQMPGKDGMKTARELRKKWGDTILIFVTAIEEYVFQAFDVGAFHYLVKPMNDEKFYQVFKNAVKKLNDREDLNKSYLEKYIMIKSGGNHIKIFLNDIVYAEVFNRKVIIHKQDGVIEYYGKLRELEKALGDDFFRPHRAYLIHFKYIVKYNATSITMINGTVLMAKGKYQEFVQKYLKYNQREGKRLNEHH